MPNFRFTLLAALLLPFLLSACDNSPSPYTPGYYGGSSNASSVWNNYDVRHPVPRSVAVPSRNPIYNNYQDNDSAYTPPRRFSCTNNLESDFCE